MLQEHTRLRSNSREIAAKIVDGDAILINLHSGLYYSLGGSGAFVWSLLARGTSVAEITDAVAARFRVSPDQVRDDLRGLANELVTEQLVVLDEGSSPGPEAGPDAVPEEDSTTGAFEPPRLVKYDDMAEIFALDPPLPELPPLPEGEREASAG